MVTTRSRGLDPQRSSNILISDLEALLRATSKTDPVVVMLKKRHSASSFRPQASLDVWRKQLLAVMEPQPRSTRALVRTPVVSDSFVDLGVDGLRSSAAASFMPALSPLVDAGAGSEAELDVCESLRIELRAAAISLRSARLEIARLTEENERWMEVFADSANAAANLASQHSPESDATADTVPPPSTLALNSVIVKGLEVGSSNKLAFKAQFVDFCGVVLQIRNVPCFKVVKVFGSQTAGRRSAIIRFNSPADLATVMKAKTEFLTASSPVRFELNRSKAVRSSRAALRAEQRDSSSRHAWTLGQLPRAQSGSRHPVVLNPNAPVFVPASQRLTPNQE